LPRIAENPRGADLSRWNVEVDKGEQVDWDDYKQYYSFVLIKATESQTYVDPLFHTLNDGAAEAGVPRGLYHFYRFRSSASSRTQAHHFWDTIQYNPGEITPWGDFEAPTGSLKISTRRTWTEQFITSFQNASGRLAGLYTSPGWWNTNIANPIVGSSDIPDVAGSPRPLWVAHWFADQPGIPYDWRARFGSSAWKFWQDTNKGDGTPAGVPDSTIDLDWYNGSYQDFNDEYGTSIKPPPQEPIVEPPPDQAARVIEIAYLKGGAQLNIRQRPWGHIKGKTWNGERWPVVGVVGYNLNQEKFWYKIAGNPDEESQADALVASWYTKKIS